MKFHYILLMVLAVACNSKPQLVVMESNFNIILYSDDEYGDNINLKKGLVEYPGRLDVGDVAFNLDPNEWNKLFKSVPWPSLQSTKNLLTHNSQQLNNNYHITFINGDLKKTINLKSLDTFPSDPQEIRQLRTCIKKVQETIRSKVDVRPLRRIDM